MRTDFSGTCLTLIILDMIRAPGIVDSGVGLLPGTLHPAKPRTGKGLFPVTQDALTNKTEDQVASTVSGISFLHQQCDNYFALVWVR